MERLKSIGRGALKVAKYAVIGTSVAATAAITAGGIYTKIGSEQRTTEVDHFNDFLNGKAAPDERITLYGASMSHQELKQFVFDTFFHCANPKVKCGPEDTDEVDKMIDSFAKMMMVEDKFGKVFNTLPALDTAGVSKSYGYGQINPVTALHVLQKYRSKLGRFPNLSTKIDEAAKWLASKNFAPNHEYTKPELKKLADILELREASNIIPAMLCFYDANISYSRIHDPKSKTNISEGKIDPKENQRALSLTVVAYSAKISSPAVAKVQSAINDIILFKPALAKSIGLPETPLDVEGDMQQISEGAFRKMAAALGDPALDKVIDDIKEHQNLPGIAPDIEAVSMFANKISGRIDMDAIINGFALRGNGPSLVSAIASRYSTIIALYDQLRKKVPQKNAKNLNDLFNAYINHRDGSFFAVLSNEAKFAEFFPNLKYEDFLAIAAEKCLEGYHRDQRYMGVVPTMYAKGGYFGAGDPKNPMERVIIAHQCFGNPIFKEPEFENRLEQAREYMRSQLELLDAYVFVNNRGTPGIKNIVDRCIDTQTPICVNKNKPASCEQDYPGRITTLKNVEAASLQCQADLLRIMGDCDRNEVVNCVKATEKAVQQRIHQDDPDYEDETN